MLIMLLVPTYISRPFELRVVSLPLVLSTTAGAMRWTLNGDPPVQNPVNGDPLVHGLTSLPVSASALGVGMLRGTALENLILDRFRLRKSVTVARTGFLDRAMPISCVENDWLLCRALMLNSRLRCTLFVVTKHLRIERGSWSGEIAPDVVTSDRVTIRLLHMCLAGKHRSLLSTQARLWHLEGLFSSNIPIRRPNGAALLLRATVVFP